MPPIARIVNTALTAVMNQYGADASPALGDRGLRWEIDLHGVLRGVVPESCPAAEVLERLVHWAAILDLVLVEPDAGTRGVFTYWGVADDRPIELRGTVNSHHARSSAESTTNTRPAGARHGNDEPHSHRQ